MIIEYSDSEFNMSIGIPTPEQWKSIVEDDKAIDYNKTEEERVMVEDCGIEEEYGFELPNDLDIGENEDQDLQVQDNIGEVLYS